MDSRNPHALWRERTLPANSTVLKNRATGFAMEFKAGGQRPKIPMKRVIAEDCSEENQNRKKLLCCLAERSNGGFSGMLKPKFIAKEVVQSKPEEGNPPPATKGTNQDGSETQRGTRTYGCKKCKTYLSAHDDILSRNFRGVHGKAYLFDTINTRNIVESEPVERNMTTGRHIVRDFSCRQCNENLGWKFDKAYESTEKYKEGKYILEAEQLCNLSQPIPT